MSEANRKNTIGIKNLEGIINELNEKKEDFENKLHKLYAENDRLSNIIKDQKSELEVERNRFQTLEKNKQEELEQMKIFYEDKYHRELVNLMAICWHFQLYLFRNQS